MARALITMPRTAKRGDVVEIRTLIAHPMETGYRPGDDGRVRPRDIIRRFTCHYDDGGGIGTQTALEREVRKLREELDELRRAVVGLEAVVKRN